MDRDGQGGREGGGRLGREGGMGGGMLGWKRGGGEREGCGERECALLVHYVSPEGVKN